jgi:cytidine deaminase
MAVDKALFDGIGHVDRIVIYGRSEKESYGGLVSPCGSCREIIRELLFWLKQQDVDVVMTNEHHIVVAAFSELLPQAELTA